jgi:RNA polymerase subunit RPABC4/transcription elongation factor Spt4
MSVGGASVSPMTPDDRADDGPMRIECDACVHQGTEQCRDCVVTFILEAEGGAVVVDAEEARALRKLGEAGLVPLLQLEPKPSPGSDEEATG